MKDRRPRTVSGGGQDASAPPLCVLVEIEPCHQTKPKIIIDFGQITVLVAKDECQTSLMLQEHDRNFSIPRQGCRPHKIDRLLILQQTLLEVCGASTLQELSPNLVCP